MSLWSYSEIASALANQLTDDNSIKNLSIENVVIDSRKVSAGSLFVALKGENNDGHNYLNQVFNAGASYAIVDRVPNDLDSNFSDKLIKVKNTFESLNLLAKFSRNRYHGKVIGLTGSVGKTTTKDMLGKVFSTQGKTHSNLGNLNNHIGLPLSLSNLPADAQFAIFEMGMNHFNEIMPLSMLARPDVAIITNVGPVHIEFFKNEQEIALAKSEIFAGLSPNGHAILNIDNIHFDFLKKRAEISNIKPSNILSFGSNVEANYKLLGVRHLYETIQTEVEVAINNRKTIKYKIGSINQTHIINSLISVACLDLIGNDLEAGLKALNDFGNSDGRGKIHQLIFNNKKISIIDDTYNASILSMKAGIENCLNYRAILNPKRTICALGDMRELGEKSSEIHSELLKFVAQKKFDLVILVGENMELANKKIVVPNSVNFSDSASAKSYFESCLSNEDLVYIKGSRGVKMEKLFENIIVKNSVK